MQKQWRFDTPSATFLLFIAHTDLRVPDGYQRVPRVPFDTWLRGTWTRTTVFELYERLFHVVRHPPTQWDLDQIRRDLERAFDNRWIVAYRAGLRPHPVLAATEPDAPPRRPATAAEDETSQFAIQFVDEVGDPIDGVDVTIAHAGNSTKVTTDGNGIARLDGQGGPSFASAKFVSVDALQRVLEPRWEKARVPRPPKGPDISEIVFRRDFPSFSMESDVQRTIVIKPVLGCLYIELWDRLGRVKHANREYKIQGPRTYDGTTDENGRLRIDEVPPGDYTLTLTVVSFEGAPDQVEDDYKAPLVVLPAGTGDPLVRMIGAVPRLVLGRLSMFFNTNKTFLLPTALPEVELLRKLYVQNNPGELLVVGHADTTGGASYNDKLSLERAQSVIAYLKDDVEGWYKFYSDSEKKKRWGKVEDHLMIIAMPDFPGKPEGEDEVRWYQRTRGLHVDGHAGKNTRRALIKEYMSLDGTSLEDYVGKITATAHGCGESFPPDEDEASSGDVVDSDAGGAAGDGAAGGGAAGDGAAGGGGTGQHDPAERQVELFFFDKEFGISPKPPGDTSKPGSTEYPTWRERVQEIVELRANDAGGPKVTFAELADKHFRTDSAVVLPEAEGPGTKGAHTVVTAPGVLATVLRFNDEHHGRTLLVAGHTDTVGKKDFNQKLSTERAEATLCLLKGGDDSRERFGTLCDKRHKVSDYKQILSWVSGAFEDLEFDCDPGEIDDNAATGFGPVLKFQNAYNTNKPSIAPSRPDLDTDGAVGPLTWRAFYDCYELALQRELGEDASGVSALRAELEFESTEHEFLGFGELFPIEELGVDNYRSEANRRVEVVFFEHGEAPDIDHAAKDPETSELYLPGYYEHEPIPPMESAKAWSANWDLLTISSDETRRATVKAPGLEAGTPVTFSIIQEEFGVVATQTVTAATDRVALDWDDWVHPDALPPCVVLDASEPFPEVAFSFEIEGGGRVVACKAPALFADFIRAPLELEFGEESSVASDNVPYTICTLWGSRSGETKTLDGEEGMIDETGLPPGGATILVENSRAF